MPRDVYYQEVGNPVQRDRLPHTRPKIQLALPTISLWQTLKAVPKAVVLLSGLLLATRFQTPEDAPFGALGYWTIYGLIGIGLLFAIVGGHCSCRSATPVLMAYAAIGLVAYVRLSPSALLVLAAGSVSLFIWLFGYHWTFVCTASPLPRQSAINLRNNWRFPLVLLSLTPFVLVVLGLGTGCELLAFVVLLALCYVQAIWPSATGAPGKLQVACASLTAWCTYNRHEFSTPGLRVSPVGSCFTRLNILTFTVTLVGAACTRSLELPLLADDQSPSIASPLQIAGAVPKLAATTSIWAITGRYVVIVGLQLVTAIALPLMLVLPVLADAGRWRQPQVQDRNWQTLIHDLQHSPDPIENRSYYMGQVVHDRSPLLVPRQIFPEHAHFPGASGTGKTGLGLAPWIEQTVAFGDCSLIVVDLKADSLELLGALTAAADRLYERSGRRLPLKYFTNQSQLSSYAFNPLTQPYWKSLDPYIKTDILCGAAGLLYGTDYGPGWYSAANAAVLHHAIKSFPDVSTLRELAARVNDTLMGAKKRELASELRHAGVHVQAILDRLGSFEALNVGPQTGHPPEVVRQAIDLADMFLRPQLLYCPLSTVLAGGSSPEIARLLVYSLLCAATQVRRQHQVFLVIDEFQRMVAHNVEHMLQMARSMGVGIILANQSLQDLGDLLPAVEANCRYRQWFSAPTLEDQEYLMRSSGETVERFVSRASGTSGGNATESTTVSEQVMRRLAFNDVALAGDHPLRSIVQITRGSGYAQYGGLPFVVESAYHISQSEYERRKAMTWPEPTAGTFIPNAHRQQIEATSPKPPQGPTIITEVIGDFDVRVPPTSPKPKRKPRKRPPEGTP